MLIDYHCHLNFSAFKNDADEVIKRALVGDVFMILVGTQIDTSRRAVEIAEKYDQGVYAAIAVHPIHLEEMEVDEEEVNFKTRAEVFDPAQYRALAQSKKVVAIGECGLDYFHNTDSRGYATDKHNTDSRGYATDKPRIYGFKEKQHKVLIQHLDLADELELPVILHCRGSKENPQDAYNDLLTILKERKPKYGGAIHCFMSTLDIAREFIKLGFYIGFTGVITFPKTDNYAEVIHELPLERILVETDAPYLAPVPFRGKRNEPLYVRYVAKKIAEIKNIDKTEVEKQLFENTRSVFGRIKK